MHDLINDCWYIILRFDFITLVDLENLRRTCSTLNHLIIEFNLIPLKCKISHCEIKCSTKYETYNIKKSKCRPKIICNRYQCCKYIIQHIDSDALDIFPLYFAVYNEWHDLIRIILSKRVLKYRKVELVSKS